MGALMGEFFDRKARVSAGVAGAVIAASAVAAALSEQIGMIVWAGSGVLGLAYGLAVVWSIRKPTPVRGAAPLAESVPSIAAGQPVAAQAVAAQAVAAAGAAAQALAAAEKVVAEAAPAAGASLPSPTRSTAFSAGLPGVVAHPASA